MSSSSDKRACQTSIVRIPANSAIASRYARTDASVDSRASASVNPLFRAAIVKLAAIRLTSYSNGPGSVSSKSFRSNTSVRSGDANMPKFDRWASPQSWMVEPGPRRVPQVGGHDLGGAAVEGERRHHHPTVADRHQVRLAGRVLLLEQGHRIGPVRRRRPHRVAGPGSPRVPPCPAPCGPRRRAAPRSLISCHQPLPGAQGTPKDSTEATQPWLHPPRRSPLVEGPSGPDRREKAGECGRGCPGSLRPGPLWRSGGLSGLRRVGRRNRQSAIG